MQNTPSTPAPSGDSNRVVRYVMLAVGILVGAIVLVFVVAAVLALVFSRSFFDVVEFIRDVLVILLSVQGILILFGLALFVIQVARLINLLQNEFKPILESMQSTVKTVQVTTEFTSQNVIQPIMRVSAFFAGLAAFFGALANFRNVFKTKDTPDAKS